MPTDSPQPKTPQTKPLAGCPFKSCGGEARLRINDFLHDQVSCQRCGTTGKACDTPEEAIEFWEGREESAEASVNWVIVDQLAKLLGDDEWWEEVSLDGDVRGALGFTFDDLLESTKREEG